MKPILFFPLLLAAATLFSGCRTYDYRIVQPPNVPGPIADQTVVVPYDPLEYRFVRRHDYLDMRIANPTEDRIVLLGNRSYVVDPNGESHPVRGRAIAPHSYTSMLLPPRPLTYEVTAPYYGWGGGWGWGPRFGDPFWGGFYDGYYGGPYVATYNIITPFDWEWRTGLVRLRLTYDRNGKTFDHYFEIVREPEK
ncbi:MAG: hypothetical protein JWR19_2095 [Pedosphaera sp.]|nr:hypothetical protein [Pedosphaera sp.]